MAEALFDGACEWFTVTRAYETSNANIQVTKLSESMDKCAIGT